MIGILGDPHGDFNTIIKIMKSNSDIQHWLCTGDLADENNNYFFPPSQLDWISGNHENWEIIKKLDKGLLQIPNFFHIKNVTTIAIGKTKVLGLGGNYSPKYYYCNRLPKGRERHYTSDEIRACMKAKNVDVLLTHEAPSPYSKSYAKEDIGRLEISEILESVGPKIHFFGHHHKFGIYEIVEGIKSVCLDRPKDSWVGLDTNDYSFERVITSQS